MTLEAADRQRAVEAGTVAGSLARVVADAAGDCGKRIVAREDLPGASKVALPRAADPLGDVAVDRAGGVARRGGSDVLRKRGAPCPGLEYLRRASGPGRRHRLLSVHAAACCICVSAHR